MTEPLKPRIDFDGPLEVEKAQILKSARAFDGADAEKFAPARLDAPEEEEGAAEAVVESVLRPKRSLWRKMVSAGGLTAIISVDSAAERLISRRACASSTGCTICAYRLTTSRSFCVSWIAAYQRCSAGCD